MIFPLFRGGEIRGVWCFGFPMAEELEFLWHKLKVTEEEEESVNLGRECSKAANERGKNCLVMKVLSRRGVILDALRKNVRMLWKPNKSIRILVIEEEMF